MALDSSTRDTSRRQDWIWKAGVVVEHGELLSGITAALAEAGAVKVFEFPPQVSSFEVANAVDRDKPELVFVELSRTSKPAAEWILDVRRGEETPLIVAVHPAAEPGEMIAALRAGASEFLCLPVKPGIHEAMDRIGALLESRRNATTERGTIAGVLSAKGGCGATTIACHLGAALCLASAQAGAGKLVSLQNAAPRTKVLIADLDHQSPGARSVLRAEPRMHAGDAFEAVRRLSSSSWREFATPVNAWVDLLASAADCPRPDARYAAPAPEQWRVESLFRFIGRQYGWVLVDLGRHLNPSNWTLLQNIDELFIVTAPDVLALYQTRSILQTLSNRGFDKSRVKMILNKNQSSPQDFWVESIEQMFELSVFGVAPNDEAALGRLPLDRFEFPAETPFGRAMTKIAARLLNPGGPAQARKAA